MPRPRKVFEDTHVRRDVLFDAIRTGEPELFRLSYGDSLGRPLHLLADALRSFIWASPNHRFIGGDFSSVEGRIAAWFGRDEWKLQAYRDLDAGIGKGLYEVAAAGIYNIPVEAVSKQQRQVGKVSELALGFGGGVGALSRMARANKLDLATVFPTLWDITDYEKKDKAESRYEENLTRGDTTAKELSREAYLAAELIKSAWRAKHPGTVQAWRSLIDAAFTAGNNPGAPVAALGLPYARYIVAHGFLWLQLPSGRCLAYGLPEIRPVEVPWADKSLEPAKREKQPAVTVRGVGANNVWMRYPLNISICYNNLVQATARDLLVHAMQTVERHGYPVRLHVHDEIVAEVPNGVGSVAEFEKLMCQTPDWAKGLPIAAAGFALKRYAKT
jgi:DNA polymerase